MTTAASSDEFQPEAPRGRRLQVASALACAVLGFVLVAQVRATETLDERLGTEREEDLAAILADLSSQSDALQAEITDLQLTLAAFRSSAESDELAVANLQRQLGELQILAGTVAAEGEGLVLTIEDPQAQVHTELLVDVVQELRDAGAEAIAVNGVRLVASSAFTAAAGGLLVDDEPLARPYRVEVVGPSDTIAEALQIPGGVLDALRSVPLVTAAAEPLAQLVVPARGEPAPFVHGEPVIGSTEDTAQ